VCVWIVSTNGTGNARLLHHFGKGWMEPPPFHHSFSVIAVSFFFFFNGTRV
jgi:hypothetical protein